jgi:hypothetical protein
MTEYPIAAPGASDNRPAAHLAYKFAPVPEWIIYHGELTGNAVRLYAALARHGMTPDSCYPSHARLARLLGMSDRSIPAIIRDLEKVGAIRRERREIDDRQTSNGYWLAGDSPFTAHENVPPAHENVPRGALDNVGGGALRNVPKESKKEREQDERHTPLPPSADAPGSGGGFQLEIVKDTVTPLPVRAQATLERLWAVYPRTRGGSVSKKETLKRVTSALRDGVDPDVIVRGAEAYAVEMRLAGRAPEKIATPQVWVNQARWEAGTVETARERAERRGVEAARRAAERRSS